MSTAGETGQLVRSTAGELVTQIASGEVSSAEVVEAFIAQIEATAGEVNAVVQPRFDQAREEAERADASRAAGEPLGPLHGVPVTIKDCFGVEGMTTTLGIPGYAGSGRATGRPDREDAPLVARLRAAGAIVLGKTNVPQAMLMHECDNPVFGRTNLPGFPDRSPGGSTGGEAAAVAAGCSPLGLGSDLGGSIRQPAAACGVYGFKPSPGRLTIAGSQRAISRGMQAIAIQPGPIARGVADLDLGMRVLLGEGPPRRDESNEPWGDYRRVDLSRLRIAWWTDDGVFSPAVGVARAVERAADQLRSAGAEVVEAEPPDARAMTRIYLGLVSADGLASVRQATRLGKIEPQLARQLLLARLPRWSRALLAPLLRLAGQGDLSDLLRWTGARSAAGYWELTAAANTYQETFWRDLAGRCGGPVDAVLSPPYGLPALRHGSALHLLRAASHTFLANLVGAPAGVVPAGRLAAEDEQAELRNPRRAGLGIGNRFARHNADGSAGLPLAVEVMAPAGADEVALAVMAALEAASRSSRQ